MSAARRSGFAVLRSVIAALTLAIVTPASAQAPNADAAASPACGGQTVTIAAMQWPSAEVLAHIHADLLKTEFGCDAMIVPGDMTATISSMASTGQPSVAPEMWLGRVADIWNQAASVGSVREAGPSYAAGAMQGWYIPDFVAANHPDLTSAAQLKDYWQVFRPKGQQKARLISCPADWACSVINANMLKVLGIDKMFDAVEPPDRLALDRMIADAISQRQPILFYYWQPNALPGQFGLKRLELGGYDKNAAQCMALKNCVALEMSAFAPEPVATVLSSVFADDAPEIALYFKAAQMPLAEMDRLLAWQSAEGADAAATAQHFVATRKSVWEPWVALH